MNRHYHVTAASYSSNATLQVVTPRLEGQPSKYGLVLINTYPPFGNFVSRTRGIWHSDDFYAVGISRWYWAKCIREMVSAFFLGFYQFLPVYTRKTTRQLHWWITHLLRCNITYLFVVLQVPALVLWSLIIHREEMTYSAGVGSVALYFVGTAGK